MLRSRVGRAAAEKGAWAVAWVDAEDNCRGPAFEWESLLLSLEADVGPDARQSLLARVVGAGNPTPPAQVVRRVLRSMTSGWCSSGGDPSIAAECDLDSRRPCGLTDVLRHTR